MPTWNTLTGTDELLYVTFEGDVPEFSRFPVAAENGNDHVTVQGNSIYLDFSAGSGPIIPFDMNDPVHRDGDGNTIRALFILDGEATWTSLKDLHDLFWSAYGKAGKRQAGVIRGAYHKEVAGLLNAGNSRNSLGRRPNLPTLASKA